jgi:hypothetical protein
MERQPRSTNPPELATELESKLGKPLVRLRDTERSLRQKTVEVLAPIVPAELATRLGEASLVADESLEKLAEIDLAAIDDAALRPARITMGLGLVGVGALAMVFLLLYCSTLHPELSLPQQMHRYWYPYIFLVCMGVAGMFVLGREAMRSPIDWNERSDDSQP